jgi:hypothetical protein
MFCSSHARTMMLALAIGMLVPVPAAALDAVLCVKATGNGPPKFRAAKIRPPTPATCKKDEIQIGNFDGTTLQTGQYLTGIDSIPATSDLSGSTYGNPAIGAGKVTAGKIA